MRSVLSSPSNSARAATIPNTGRPFAVVVSISALAPACGKHPRGPGPVAQLVHDIHQALPLQVPVQPIELPDDEYVTRLQCLQAGLKARAVLLVRRGPVAVDAVDRNNPSEARHTADPATGSRRLFDTRAYPISLRRHAQDPYFDRPA